MKARSILLTLVAAVLIATPLVLVAQAAPGGGPGNGPDGQGPGGRGHGGGHHGSFEAGQGLAFFDRMLPRLADRIGLNDDQIEQIHALVDEARPAIENSLEELRAGREAYRSQNNDPTVFDEGAFRTHAAAQHAIQTELKVVVERTKAQVFGVLTVEQREELEEIRATMHNRSGRRGGGRRSQ